MMKRTVLLALCAALALSGASEAAVKLRLGNKMIATHPESVALQMMADNVKARTNGEVEIQCYFGEVLGDAKKQIENMIRGVQDFYADGYGYYDMYAPLLRAPAVPYMFRDNEHYRNFLLSDMEKEVEEPLLKKAGLRVVNSKRNWLRGPFRVIASRKPIRSLEDLKGLKLRMNSNPTSVRAWEQLGCAVTVIPYTETYLALKQGTVDAVTCPVVDAYLFKFCEVAPYLTITYEYPQQVAVVMNDRKFQKLTKEQQEILLDEINKAGDYVTEQALNKCGEIIEKMKKEYGVEMIEVDLAPWRAKMEPFIEELENRDYIPKGYAARIRAVK
ncbi:MAG: TRAP transporter substrate-binding protein [Pyramidobacter sp.]|nr:TRAP transporter substrate-binding protein [Pyramidobacter sp.]